MEKGRGLRKKRARVGMGLSLFSRRHEAALGRKVKVKQAESDRLCGVFKRARTGWIDCAILAEGV